jgi:hypothetical protein
MANAALVLKSMEQNHGYSPTLLLAAALKIWREIPIYCWGIIAVISAIGYTVEHWIASNLVCECFTRREKIMKEF